MLPVIVVTVWAILNFLESSSSNDDLKHVSFKLIINLVDYRMSFELTYQIVFQIFHFWNAFHFVNFTIWAPINTNFWEHFKEVVCHINAWLMYDLNKKFAFRNMLVHIKKIKTHASIVWLPSSIRISFFH